MKNITDLCIINVSLAVSSVIVHIQFVLIPTNSKPRTRNSIVYWFWYCCKALHLISVKLYLNFVIISDLFRPSVIHTVLLFFYTCWLQLFASHCWHIKRQKSMALMFMPSQQLDILFIHSDKFSISVFSEID